MAPSGAARYPHDVQNFGVLDIPPFRVCSYSRRASSIFVPSIVVIGFGMNDSEVAGYRDKDIVAEPVVRR